MINALAAAQADLKALGVFSKVVQKAGARGGDFSPEFFSAGSGKLANCNQVITEQLPKRLIFVFQGMGKK